MAEEEDPRRIAEEYHRVWEGGGEIDKDLLVRVLGEAVQALEDEDIPYALMGGVVSAIAGRPRFTHDIDFLVKGEHARPALAALDAAGFTVDQTDPQWLYKAVKDGILVDVIFRASGDVMLDDEMLERASVVEFEGVRARMLPVEDVIMIKALGHEEHTGRHWYDALALLANRDVDWDYLVRRSARRGPNRMLSLLFYARSMDIIVPSRVVHELYRVISEPEEG